MVCGTAMAEAVNAVGVASVGYVATVMAAAVPEAVLIVPLLSVRLVLGSVFMMVRVAPLKSSVVSPSPATNSICILESRCLKLTGTFSLVRATGLAGS